MLMECLNVIIDNRDVAIYYPQDESGKWFVQWEGFIIGYVYIERIDNHTDEAVWAASTDLLDAYVNEIGNSIEGSNL